MKKASAGRIVPYAIAAIVGFLLGSYGYLMPASIDKIEVSPASTSGTAVIAPIPAPSGSVPPGDDRGAQRSGQPTSRFEPVPDESKDEWSSLIFAREGLVLRPAVSGAEFVGYLVVRNDSDRRFSVGDVIVSVNGQSVENSPAGSELLIAWLADRDVPVEVRSAETEQP